MPDIDSLNELKGNVSEDTRKLNPDVFPKTSPQATTSKSEGFRSKKYRRYGRKH